MKIVDIKSLPIPDVKVITFSRFKDNRGYFTETYRNSDLVKVIPDFCVKQINESYSSKGALRGLHAQWNPYMGKLVRTLYGHMIDLVLDIRIGSNTFGKLVAYDMPADNTLDYDQWLWVPVGFAHGNFYTQNSAIEYLCTGDYSPDCEISINPLSDDIDWSTVDKKIKDLFVNMKKDEVFIQSPKDKNGFSLSQWKQNPDSIQFKI